MVLNKLHKKISKGSEKIESDVPPEGLLEKNSANRKEDRKNRGRDMSKDISITPDFDSAIPDE